jgi:hypothetical protein
MSDFRLRLWLCVQLFRLPPEALTELRESLRNMKDFYHERE